MPENSWIALGAIATLTTFSLVESGMFLHAINKPECKAVAPDFYFTWARLTIAVIVILTVVIGIYLVRSFRKKQQAGSAKNTSEYGEEPRSYAGGMYRGF
jgi:uncharacterized membrane protein